MSTTGKPNSTRRSSGPYGPQERKIFGPPKDEPWVWLTTALLYSTAWRAMRPNTRKLIDFLLIEHRNHAGLENSNLIATYGQLEAYGLTRQRIRMAIDEAEALGLVRVNRQGLRRATKYRLTFIATADRAPPTNDWKAVTESDVSAWRAEIDRREAGKRRRHKKQFSGLRTSTQLVHEQAPDCPSAAGISNTKSQKTANSP